MSTKCCSLLILLAFPLSFCSFVRVLCSPDYCKHSLCHLHVSPSTRLSFSWPFVFPLKEWSQSLEFFFRVVSYPIVWVGGHPHVPHHPPVSCWVSAIYFHVLVDLNKIQYTRWEHYWVVTSLLPIPVSQSTLS